ncbi:MAG: uracil-DNA glycosylase [Candidatus Omnitrophica bacterium]|nr:uracil-DNA glycosylase [Candidatus Omnitrophota bacterium]MCM8778080.1 uracil-DNA glycosylase [Candidatus Omnitrophota bacterium]
MDKQNLLEECRRDVMECKRCVLWKTRKNVVFGQGKPEARIVFVGEAPGYNEDLKGIPFCGKAGEVLDILLSSINLKREDVYITNIIKCRPPENRDPEEEEIEKCTPYLERQIEIIKPSIICCLGRYSLRYFINRFSLKEKGSISTLHGRVMEIREGLFSSVKIVALYHPAVAVYDPNKLELLKRDFHILSRFNL